jgi:type I restriction enzyme M protein
MSTPSALVSKLWNYCNILRDDGLSYGDYVEQLTFLLFLKMADEQSKPLFNKPSAPQSILQKSFAGKI